ncbi:MAG: GtrA family protein [Saccharofermentanales bacterium]
MRNKQKILHWLSLHDDRVLWRLLEKRYELLAYLFFGGMTTLVNLVVYTFLEGILGQSAWYLSNLPAILIAILFAYITNRSFVFDSTGGFWTEMYKFFGARILVSLVFEYGTVYLLYDILHFDARLDLMFFAVSWFKIISILFVLIANYVVSKVFVFRNSAGHAS